MKPASSVRLWTLVQIAMQIVFGITLIGVVVVVARLANSTQDALCSFKADIEGRIVQTATFIQELEEGSRPPIPGISLADLKRSLQAQEATIASLRDLRC